MHLFGSLYSAILYARQEVAWRSADGTCVYCCATHDLKHGSLKPLVSYLAVSVSGVWAGVGWNCGPAEAGMGSALPPSSLGLLAEVISLWL